MCAQGVLSRLSGDKLKLQLATEQRNKQRSLPSCAKSLLNKDLKSRSDNSM